MLVQFQNYYRITSTQNIIKHIPFNNHPSTSKYFHLKKNLKLVLCKIGITDCIDIYSLRLPFDPGPWFSKTDGQGCKNLERGEFSSSFFFKEYFWITPKQIACDSWIGWQGIFNSLELETCTCQEFNPSPATLFIIQKNAH